jgi:hypothetical protein
MPGAGHGEGRVAQFFGKGGGPLGVDVFRVAGEAERQSGEHGRVPGHGARGMGEMGVEGGGRGIGFRVLQQIAGLEQVFEGGRAPGFYELAQHAGRGLEIRPGPVSQLAQVAAQKTRPNGR